jgi:acyl-coenzyme A synthetase/AMP-(fatty) acid ligase
VEVVLMSHPAVAQVAVVPRTDPFREEEVAAVVVARDLDLAHSTLAHDLLTYTAQSLAYYKSPGHIIFVAELPTTSTGKLAKGLIREIANDEKSGLSRFDLRKEKQQMRTLAHD